MGLRSPSARMDFEEGEKVLVRRKGAGCDLTWLTGEVVNIDPLEVVADPDQITVCDAHIDRANGVYSVNVCKFKSYKNTDSGSVIFFDFFNECWKLSVNGKEDSNTYDFAFNNNNDDLRVDVPVKWSSQDGSRSCMVTAVNSDNRDGGPCFYKMVIQQKHLKNVTFTGWHGIDFVKKKPFTTNQCGQVTEETQKNKGVEPGWIAIVMSDEDGIGRKTKMLGGSWVDHINLNNRQILTNMPKPYNVLFATKNHLLRRVNFINWMKEDMAKDMQWLCRWNFIPVPLSYGICKMGYPNVASCLVIPVLYLSFHYQRQIFERVLDKFEEMIPIAEDQGCFPVVLNELRGPAKLPVLGWSLCWPKWWQVHLEELLEYADPMLDAIMAGSAGGLLNSEANEKFQESWDTTPIVGSLVSSLGLEGTLTTIVVLCTLAQFTWCERSMKRFKAKSKCLATNAQLTYANQACALASCGLLANLLNELAMKEDGEGVEHGRDLPYIGPVGSMQKIALKVWIENTPSAVFTITLLGLSLRFSPPTAFQFFLQCFSITTSINAVFQTTMTGVKDFRYTTADMGRRWSPFRLMLYTSAILAFLPVVMLLARFLGVLYCPSHVYSFVVMTQEIFSFQLDTLGCEDN